MSKVFIPKNNKKEIDRIISNPTHSLIIDAPSGYGKYYLAKYISSNILGLKNIELLSNYPYFYEIIPENKSISIDQIRTLKNIFKLRTTGNQNIRRIVVIKEADLMNDESQNSILKTLEEPPIDSLIILTTSNIKKLKSTVLSRSQILRLNKPDKEELLAFLNISANNGKEISSLYAFSNGAYGQIINVNNNEPSEVDGNYINQTKELLNDSKFIKLAKVEVLAKNKEDVVMMLFALKQIAKSFLYLEINKNNEKKAKYWLNILKLANSSDEQLNKGANVKLLLTNLFIHM